MKKTEKTKHSVAIYFCVSKSSPKQYNTGFKFYNGIVTHEFVVNDIKKTKKTKRKLR